MIQSTMDGYNIFLVGRPNTIAAWSSRRLLICGVILVILGIVCLADASVAFHFKAVKSYGMQLYFNTHWINVVHLLTGTSYVLADRHKSNFFLFLSVLFTIFSLAVGFGSVVGSCVNIQSVRQLESLRRSSNALQIVRGFTVQQSQMALICNAVDIVCNFGAITICSVALLNVYHMSTRYFQSVCNPSGKLVVLGLLTIVIGATKFALWIADLVWLHSTNPQPNFIFLNYTFDEPIWILLYTIGGALVAVVGFRGSRIVIHVALLITALSYHPVIQYFWVDYRWAIKLNNSRFASVPMISSIIWANIVIATVHLCLLVTTVLVLCKALMNSRAQGFLFNFSNVTARVRLVIGSISLALILLGILFLASDILNIQHQSFYRIFWPTEQKLPFILVPAGVICLLMFQDQMFSYLLMPISFVLLLQCLQYCLFHVSAYLYLSAIRYAPGRFCARYLEQPARCDYILKKEASVAHFIEALAAVVVMAISVISAIILGRLMGLYQISIGSLTAAKQQQKNCAERFILATGAVELLMGLIAVPFVAINGTWGKGFEGDPLFVIHGSISLSCFCAPFLILPFVHICFAPDLHLYPLRSIAIMVAGGIRLVDIFLLLDSRSIQSLNPVMLVILVVELISVLLVFITVVAAGLVLDVSVNHLPNFDFTEEATAVGGESGGFTCSEDFGVTWHPAEADSRAVTLSSQMRLGFSALDSQHQSEPITTVHAREEVPSETVSSIGIHDKMFLIS